VVELHGTFVTVFIVLGRNDRLDAEVEQIPVDPIGAVPFVSAEFHWPRHGLAVAVV
jgi:hypothetical protein